MADRIGQQLGHYRLIRLLGQGGFADVYLGEHIHLNTQAAIKVLRTQLVSDDVTHFRTEARTVAHLQHPNIVQILDFGVEGSTPFLVMAYAPNGTLRQRHTRGVPLPFTTILPYVKQIASALQYAHDQRLIHRDIKPENMLLGRNNEVLLSDFGIALVTQSDRARSIINQSMSNQSTWDPAGTVSYMAPEQIQGKPCPASDQYALGVVVYEWLTGSRPFNGAYMEIAVQHISMSPQPMREKVAAISPDIEKVVLTALSKDPQQRFGSVQAFANALEQAYQMEWSTLRVSQSNTPSVPSNLSGGATTEAVIYGPSGRIILGSNIVTIGRLPDNQLVINDPRASSHHAEIRPGAQGHSIVDLSSMNGTFVNDQRLDRETPRLLNRGDTIRIGDTKLIYDVGSALQNRPLISGGPTQRAAPSDVPGPLAHSAYGFGAVQENQSVPQVSFYPSAPQQPFNTPSGASGGVPGNVVFQQSGGIPIPSNNMMTPVLQSGGIPSQSSGGVPIPSNNMMTPAQQSGGIPFQPIGAPPVPPTRPDRRKLWIVLGIVGILLLVGGGVFAYVGSLPTPAKTLDKFCTAIQSGDDTTAYNQTSSQFQSKTPMPLFTGFFSKVTSCTYSSLNASGNSATATLAVAFNAAGTDNDQITLIQGNNSWQIDDIANLSALIKTFDTYCGGLKGANFQQAWDQFSSNLQGKISESVFASFFPNVTSCTYTSLSASGGNATANLMVVSAYDPAENDQVTLIQDSNKAWKIDAVSHLSLPAKTLNAYCDALKRQMFSLAYDQLSSRVRNQWSPTGVANYYKGITNCAVSNVDNSTGVGTIAFAFNNGVTGSADYTMVLESGIWKIDTQQIRQ